MSTYRKKPVEVEAVQWTLDNAPEIEAFLGHPFTVTETGYGIPIETREGTMLASPQDFIIRGVQGEFYPCKPDIFAATYEEVLKEREAEEWRDSWDGRTIRVGDYVKSWWGNNYGTVTRIFQHKKGARWEIEWDGPKKGNGRMFASDFNKVMR